MKTRIGERWGEILGIFWSLRFVVAWAVKEKLHKVLNTVSPLMARNVSSANLWRYEKLRKRMEEKESQSVYDNITQVM